MDAGVAHVAAAVLASPLFVASMNWWIEATTSAFSDAAAHPAAMTTASAMMILRMLFPLLEFAVWSFCGRNPRTALLGFRSTITTSARLEHHDRDHAARAGLIRG